VNRGVRPELMRFVAQPHCVKRFTGFGWLVVQIHRAGLEVAELKVFLVLCG
jgi:hypothetical protein